MRLCAAALQGRRLSLTVHRGAQGQATLQGMSNSATIVYPNIELCEGVAHAVDAVLVPVALDGQGAGGAPAAGG